MSDEDAKLAAKLAENAAYGQFGEPAGDKTGPEPEPGEIVVALGFDSTGDADADALCAYAINPPPERPIVWTEIASTTAVRDVGGRTFEGIAEGAWALRLITYDATLPNPKEPAGARGSLGIATRIDTRHTFELPGDLAALLGYQAESTLAAAAGRDEVEWLEVQAGVAPPPEAVAVAEESAQETSSFEGSKLVKTQRNKKPKEEPSAEPPKEEPSAEPPKEEPSATRKPRKKSGKKEGPP